MVADHDEQHRQREVVVVHAALLGALPSSGFGADPPRIAATIRFWPGMMMKKTFAAMIVPMAVPTWMNTRGRRAADSPQARTPIRTNTTAPSRPSRFAQRRAAEQVVDDPRAQHAGGADAHGLERRERHDVAVDHHGPGLQQ